MRPSGRTGTSRDRSGSRHTEMARMSSTPIRYSVSSAGAVFASATGFESATGLVSVAGLVSAAVGCAGGSAARAGGTSSPRAAAIGRIRTSTAAVGPNLFVISARVLRRPAAARRVVGRRRREYSTEAIRCARSTNHFRTGFIVDSDRSWCYLGAGGPLGKEVLLMKSPIRSGMALAVALGVVALIPVVAGESQGDRVLVTKPGVVFHKVGSDDIR